MIFVTEYKDIPVVNIVNTNIFTHHYTIGNMNINRNESVVAGTTLCFGLTLLCYFIIK